MPYLTAFVKWSRFALDLVVVFFSRIGAIGLGMMAGSLLFYAILGYATGHHSAEGSLAARLEGVVFAVFVTAMIFFAIGCTLQQRDRKGAPRGWRGLVARARVDLAINAGRRGVMKAAPSSRAMRQAATDT